MYAEIISLHNTFFSHHIIQLAVISLTVTFINGRSRIDNFLSTHECSKQSCERPGKASIPAGKYEQISTLLLLHHLRQFWKVHGKTLINELIIVCLNENELL